MTLVEHIRELRDRLFKAVLGIVLGMIVGLIVAGRAQDFLTAPYCERFANGVCQFNAVTPLSPLIVNLKIALYVGLILSSPIWLFQLWSFITPGLHRNERAWAYGFVAFAVPLFVAGAALAHIVVGAGLNFLLPDEITSVDLAGYIDFVTGMLVLFGVGFEFPLVVFMLNLAGVASARRLLGWWRPAIFLIFLFTAIATPTADPFGMTALAGAMTLLYFAAVGASFLNERRRARKARRSAFGDLADDEISPLDDRIEPVGPREPIPSSEPVAPSVLDERDRRLDDPDIERR